MKTVTASVIGTYINLDTSDDEALGNVCRWMDDNKLVADARLLKCYFNIQGVPKKKERHFEHTYKI